MSTSLTQRGGIYSEKEIEINMAQLHMAQLWYVHMYNSASATRMRIHTILGDVGCLVGWSVLHTYSTAISKMSLLRDCLN